jgi:hypothetical protein
VTSGYPSTTIPTPMTAMTSPEFHNSPTLGTGSQAAEYHGEMSHGPLHGLGIGIQNPQFTYETTVQHAPEIPPQEFNTQPAPTELTQTTIPSRSTRRLLRPTPAPRRIAPHPVGRREEEERESRRRAQATQRHTATRQPRRRRRRNKVMEEETDLVEELRAQGLDWKAVAAEFYRRTGKRRSVEALQMRLNRRNARRNMKRLSWSDAEVGLCVNSYVLS